MQFLVAIAAVALLSSASHAFPQDIQKTAEEALAKVNEVIDIPQLKNLNVTEALGKINIGSLPIGEAENILRKKCEKNGGSYDTAKKAATDLFACVQPLVNVTKLKEEVDAARPTGDLDEVFNKYCIKKPIFSECLVKFGNAIEPCLEEVEKENKRIVYNITEKILSFACFKEGDRIALFVAAKGPECFQSKAVALGQCANSTYGSYKDDLPFNPADGLTGLTDKLAKISDLPPFVFDEKSCTNMNTLQRCSVNALEGCDDPTPANLLDSIFNYIKKVTPCEKLTKKD